MARKNNNTPQTECNTINLMHLALYFGKLKLVNKLNWLESVQNPSIFIHDYNKIPCQTYNTLQLYKKFIKFSFAP